MNQKEEAVRRMRWRFLGYGICLQRTARMLVFLLIFFSFSWKTWAAEAPSTFETNLDLVTAEKHPMIRDTLESARSFWRNAPKGAVLVTSWQEYEEMDPGQAPEFGTLWFNGGAMDPETGAEEIYYVDIDYQNIGGDVDIDEAILQFESFIPKDLYQASGERAKYVNTGGDPSREYLVYWFVQYESLSVPAKSDLVSVFYADSEKHVVHSFNLYLPFSGIGELVGSSYTEVDWRTSVEEALGGSRQTTK